VIDAVFVCSLGATFFVQDLRQFTPLLGVLVSVVRDHDAVFVWCKIVLWRLVVKSEDTLSRFTLEIGVDEVASLCFSFAELQWKVGFFFRISHASLWFAILLSHSLLFRCLE
jgi:hypothetical protein